MSAETNIWEKGREVAAILADNGFTAYFAGGAVRDMLLGVASKDVDIATSATPEDISAIFPKHYEVGAAFGIINVLHGDECFEVATFREECGYSDGRRPDEVSYTTDPKLDALRRDFTINSLFYDPLKDKILDFTGGRRDLAKGLLRCVGDPEERFSEDYLRILRVARFAVRFRFKIDAALGTAALRNVAGIARLSAERIRDELNKILTGSDPESAVRMLSRLGVLSVALPELEETRGVLQPKRYHPEGDVFEHTCLMLSHMSWPSVELVWSLLLHDIGKPDTFFRDENGVERFYQHDSVGAEKAENIMKRLKFPKKTISDVVSAVGGHMRFGSVDKMREAKVRRLIADPTFRLQLELHRIDCAASHGKMGNYLLLIDKIREIRDEPKLPPPLLTGKDLIAMGFKPGPRIGELLRELMDMQLEGAIATPENARRHAQRRGNGSVGSKRDGGEANTFDLCNQKNRGQTSTLLL
ncbi:MAG: CCA tRNA nucleotidyltransferase, partial [Victivallales bacterium]|nr:CCA tRNA nucleotidyltransferase [Victivallales bacterium]